jgi:YgiT-type zinc finger domain-containing protein
MKTTPTKAFRCVTCGHRTMRRVVRDVVTHSGKRRTVVSNIEIDECSHCGERLYDLEALKQIRAKRTARRPSKRSRRTPSAA